MSRNKLRNCYFLNSQTFYQIILETGLSTKQGSPQSLLAQKVKQNRKWISDVVGKGSNLNMDIINGK